MKLKLIEIINCNAVLNELANNKTNNIKATYKIAKINKRLTSELELVEQQRLDIIKKYCLKDESNEPIIKDKQYVIPPENNENLQKDLQTFLSIEIELDIEPLTINELEGYSLSSKQLTELLVIIKEEQ